MRHVATAVVAIGLLWAWIGPLVAGDRHGAAGDHQHADATELPGLLARLPKARVAHGNRQCRDWTGTRWECGLAAWEWVGPYRGRATTDRGRQWRTCLWMHPRSSGGRGDPLTVTFDEIPLAEGLSGEAALLDTPKKGSGVDFTVRVDGKQRARIRLTDQRGREWKEWTVVPRDDDPATGTVQLEIRASNPDWRHTCVTAFEGNP